MKDAVNNSMLPPLEAIQKNNSSQIASLTQSEHIATFDITPELKLVISLQEKSEYEPHLTIAAGADQGVMHIIINGLHPYYGSLESSDAIDECIRQYIYDTIAEYRVSKLQGRVNPDSVRRLKNDLLRVQVLRIENAAASVREGNLETSVNMQ